MKTTSLWIWALGLLTLWSCGSDEEKPWQRAINAEQVLEMSVEVIRLEEAFVSAKTPAQMGAFLDRHPAFCQMYFGPNIHNRDLFISQALQFTTNPLADTMLTYFQQVSDGKINAAARQLEDGFKKLKTLYPDIILPKKIYTIFTGFLGVELNMNQDMIAIDIGFFNGSESEHKPQTQFYADYILDQLIYERIPHLVVANIIRDGFNSKNNSDQTMLNEMIFQGKTLYCLENIFPNDPDSLLIGYSGEQVANANFNAKIVWEHFVERKLFYETEQMLIRKYVGQSPKVQLIDEDCPGRIGGWLGWQVVRSYMANQPEISIQELMANTEVKQIFQQSGYRGEAL